MILVEIQFGSSTSLKRSELEEIAENYIASLFQGGQLCGEYFLTWISSQLICHTLVQGSGAENLRYHSQWAASNLEKVVAAFGQQPVWAVRDDDSPDTNPDWTATPYLYLFTHAFDWKSPVSRGDTGQPIPIFLLPLDFERKSELVRWQAEYILYDRLWLNSGSLELAAYKELADPNSELSKTGRELCLAIEKAVAIPTFYFLMRFYSGHAQDTRPCPGCGEPWEQTRKSDSEFHNWPFRCDRCRLASTFGVELDQRRARIGQWKKRLPVPKQSIR